MGSAGCAPKVLIVEDEAIISLDIKRLLANSGFGVAAVAATAKQAIRLVQSSSPDLVLMDIHIKGPVDGIDAAHHIRQTFRLPVVFVTAHADKDTLERARQSEPFGIILKPISALGLVSAIKLALHRHSVQRQLEEHRAWLEAVLENIPHAVLVTDLGGHVQFVNSAAERLLELASSDAAGKPIDSVLALVSGDQSNLASQLLDRAEWGNRTSFPRETVLRRNASSADIRVEGEVGISYTDGEPAGAIFTLRDVSRREQEENMLRQEERMLALGALSAGIARDFSSLHALLDATCDELSGITDGVAKRARAALLDKIDTICRIGAMGSLLAGQLSQLNAPLTMRATYVSASGVVAWIEPLLSKLSGPALRVDVHLTDESTLVVCHPDRLQMLLLNVFLSARERMAGSGRMRISTRQKANSAVSILFEIEHVGIAGWRPLAFPLEMEAPVFSLSIAQAIATAMEGSVDFKLLSDTQGEIEIVLPLQAAAEDLTDPLRRRGTVLLVGSELEILGKIDDQLEAAHYGVIRCSSSLEALLLGQLFDGRIDVVIACLDGVSASHRRKLHTFFSNRNAATEFIRLLSEPEPEEQGWRSIPKYPQTSVAERMSRLLGADNGVC